MLSTYHFEINVRTTEKLALEILPVLEIRRSEDYERNIINIVKILLFRFSRRSHQFKFWIVLRYITFIIALLHSENLKRISYQFPEGCGK